jgi:hypothetical protein
MGAFGLAGTAVGLADTIAREAAHFVLSSLHHLRDAGGQGTGTGPTTAAAADAAVTDVEDAPPGPTVVPVEPHAPEEHLAEPLLDPADGKALAAELQMMSRAAIRTRADPDPHLVGRRITTDSRPSPDHRPRRRPG